MKATGVIQVKKKGFSYSLNNSPNSNENHKINLNVNKRNYL